MKAFCKHKRNRRSRKAMCGVVSRWTRKTWCKCGIKCVYSVWHGLARCWPYQRCTACTACTAREHGTYSRLCKANQPSAARLPPLLLPPQIKRYHQDAQDAAAAVSYFASTSVRHNTRRAARHQSSSSNDTSSSCTLPHRARPSPRLLASPCSVSCVRLGTATHGGSGGAARLVSRT